MSESGHFSREFANLLLQLTIIVHGSSSNNLSLGKILVSRTRDFSTINTLTPPTCTACSVSKRHNQSRDQPPRKIGWGPGTGYGTRSGDENIIMCRPRKAGPRSQPGKYDVNCMVMAIGNEAKQEGKWWRISALLSTVLDVLVEAVNGTCNNLTQRFLGSVCTKVSDLQQYMSQATS